MLMTGTAGVRIVRLFGLVDCSIDCRVLFEAVRRIVPRHSVERVGRAVADGVVGILILLHLPALEVPFSEFVK